MGVWSMAVLAALGASSAPLAAQVAGWDLTVVLSPTLPPRVDVLAKQAGFLSVIVTYSGDRLARFEVRSRLSASSGLSASASSVPRTATGPGTHLFTNTTRALVDDPTLRLPAAWEKLAQRGGVLPADRYRFCAAVYVDDRAVTAERCANTTVELPQPPQLIGPAEGSVVASATPVFTWTPVTQIDATTPVRYQLRLAELPAGRLPAEALGTLAWHEAEIDRRTQYVYPPSALPLKDGVTYVWQVTAYDADGQTFGAGGGRSLSQRFTYRDPAAAVALGEVEVAAGIAVIPSLRGAMVVGGDPARLIVSGQVPMRLTLAGGEERLVNATLREAVISRGPGVARLIGGELDAVVGVEWEGARMDRLRLGRGGVLQTAGTLTVGGRALPAVGTLAAGAPLLDAVGGGALPARIGSDTLAVIVRGARLLKAGAAVEVTAEPELFGAPSCRPSLLDVADTAVVVALDCTTKSQTPTGATLTTVRGQYRVAGTRVAAADLALEVAVALPFVPTRGAVLVSGRYTQAAGFIAMRAQLLAAQPALDFGSLRLRLRSLTAPRLSWTRAGGWQPRVSAAADVSVPSVSLAISAVDSLVVTADAIELPAVERDASVFTAPSFTGGDIRVRPRAVRWNATRLAFADGGAAWRANLSGAAGVAHVSPCVQALQVPATRGVLTNAGVDWPLDTARVRGACTVRKADGTLAAVESVTGQFSGTVREGAMVWSGQAAFVERAITVAAAPPTEQTPASEDANIPATLRVPGGTLTLRDGANRPLVTARRLDPRTLEFTPLAAGALPFEAIGGLSGTARFARLSYATQNARLAAGDISVVFSATDPRRQSLLAAVPADVDSLVVRGSLLAPAATLYASVRLFGRRLDAPLRLVVDELGVASGSFDVTLAAPVAFDLASGGALQLRALRVRGMARVPLAGGALQRDLVLEADLAAPGIARPFTLRVASGGEGALGVLGARAARATREPRLVRMDSLQLSALSWSAVAGFRLTALADGAARVAVRGGGTFDVPLRGIALNERELLIASARVVADAAPAVGPAAAGAAQGAAPSALAPGVTARVLEWTVPAWSVAWPRWATATLPDFAADATVQFDRVAALRNEWFTARLTLRGDSTVCGTATARPLARPALVTQGGAQLRLTDITPAAPACGTRNALWTATAQAALLRAPSLQAAADAWVLATPLSLEIATGTLSGSQNATLSATARAGALELQLGAGLVSVRADSITWTGQATGRLLPPQATPTPTGAGQITVDLGAGRLAAGRIEITQPFGWRVPSGAGVLAVQVPRALLDANGAVLLGDGSIDGTAARIVFDSLRLDAIALRITGGRARVQGTLPLALEPNGWRISAAGQVTLPLVDPTLDASGLAAAAAAPSSLNALGVAVASLDTRLTANFRFGVDPGQVTVGRADLHDNASANAPRRAWVDSLGLHVEGAMPALPDSIALPDFGVAYARLRVNGQLVPSSVVGGALTVNASVNPVEVVFPSLGGVSVPMLGSFTIDGVGRISGGSLNASFGNTPLDLAGSGLPLQLRALAFGPVGGALGMRASISVRALPGLGDFALPNGDLTLSAAGLSGMLATGSCAGNAPPVAERTYAQGALTLRLLGFEANLTQRTLCARLDAVAQLGGAAAPSTVIPVSASWNVQSGRWMMTAAAQQLPELTIGVAVLTPDAQQGITVVAQDPGTFALLMRGGVRFPQALGDGVAIAIDTLRVATDGVRIAANSTTPQQITLFSDLLSLTTSRIAADYAGNLFTLTVDGALSLLGRSNLAMQGLVLRSDGTVSGGSVEFGQSISLLAGRLSLASLAFASTGGRLGVDLGGSLSLPAPFSRSAPFTVQVRPSASGWSAEMQAPNIAFGTQLAIGDNADTEIRFGSVATFDLLNLGIALDLRAPQSARITASAALYLMNDVGRAIVFGSPSNAAAEPGLLIDGGGVRWNATLPGNLPTLDLGLFRYALTGFGGVSAGASFGLEFSGQASLDVPGVEGTMALEGLRIGLDGASPGRLGNGPHELSLMGGLASFRIGAMERGANTSLTLTEAGAGARANTTTVQAEEFIRLTNASMSLGMGFFEGGVREVLIYRLADGTRSLGVTDAALSLAGITTLNASMRYVNGPEGYRLSAGGSAVIVGGTGFGAAGFFSNRGGSLGAGIFVAANANIPLLPPLISLSGIGGGLFINPTGEDVQMVLTAVEGLGVRLVGDPPPLPRGEERMGFAAFLYGGVGLIGAAGGYAIDGKGLLQLTTAYVRIDVRGVLLGQTDHLDAGVMFQVAYGNGVTVSGAGEVTIDYPGADGRATVDFFAGNQGGSFDWAFSAQARLRVVAFNARGALFVSRDGFYAEVGIGSGFSYGPVDIGAEVMVGVFVDVSRPKFGAFGIVSAHVDLEIAEASATLKGAIVASRSGVYLGFGGVGRARVADYEISGAVHASFDNGDFSAGLGRDKKLDRVIDEMRSTANRIEAAASTAATQLRASAEANWWRADAQTLSNAGFALITLPADERARILAPVFAAEARASMLAAEDRAPVARSLAPSALRQWVLDSVYADPSRPSVADVAADRAAFEGLAAGTGTVAASVLDRVRLRIEGAPTAAGEDMPAGSPLSVTASAGQPMRMTLDAAAYDAVGARLTAAGTGGGSLETASALLAQAESALDTLDHVLGSAPGAAASLANAGELFALSRTSLERWQARRIALGVRARDWATRRRAALMIYGSGTTQRYQLGWGVTVATRRGYLTLVDAAVARRQALLDLAAFSAPLGAPQPVSNAQTFRAQLLALDTIPGRDTDFLTAVAGTWGELWLNAPNRGLATMADSANNAAAPLLPVFAVQRDSLARRHQALSTVVEGLYGGRYALTAQLAALYDEARLMPGAPEAWTARRDALMADLEPPSLSDIRVQSTTSDAVVTSAVTWTSAHPGGLAGADADASRDGGATPAYIGGVGQVTVATSREAPSGDIQRRYNVGVRARSRAGASVTRAAIFDVDIPVSSRGDAFSSAPAVRNAADYPPAPPSVSYPYTLVEPLPVAVAGGGVGNANLNRAVGGALGGGLGAFAANAPLATGANAPPPATDTRVYFWGDRTALDIDVVQLNLNDLAALEVAIGTTPGGEEVRAFAAAPAVPTETGRRIMLRGLSLERDIDYWVRVRARDAAGQRSSAAGVARPLRIDDRLPVAPLLRAIERTAAGAIVRLSVLQHEPSRVRMLEYAVSRLSDAPTVFGLVTPNTSGGDSVLVNPADLVPGQSVWVHVRAVSYAGIRGPARSIEVVTPPNLTGLVPAGTPAVPGFQPPAGPGLAPRVPGTNPPLSPVGGRLP